MIDYRVFTLPVHEPGTAETELNGFQASHRVQWVDRQFVEDGECNAKVQERLGEKFSILTGEMERVRMARTTDDAF
jgi:hypothetical protein